MEGFAAFRRDVVALVVGGDATIDAINDDVDEDDDEVDDDDDGGEATEVGEAVSRRGDVDAVDVVVVDEP